MKTSIDVSARSAGVNEKSPEDSCVVSECFYQSVKKQLLYLEGLLPVDYTVANRTRSNPIVTAALTTELRQQLLNRYS